MSYQRGTVFLEIVITVGVLAILIGAILNLVLASYDLLGYSRTRITARHLANEKIELIRNLPYDNVAVEGGVPAGSLPQLETISRNGLDYLVRTNVVYIDDEYDELAPTDTLPIDYKRARVDVSWTGTFASDSTVTLITDIAPPGVESVGAGGTISILVSDSLGSAVEGADVHLTNTEVDPNIDLWVKTNSFGRVLLPGAPICNECYMVEVTREGYSTDRTYTNAEVANPFQPLVSVADQEVTEVSFSIDALSTLSFRSVQSRDNDYAVMANQFFNLRGSKVIGTDVSENSVYKYDELLQTDGSGNLVKTDVEWDSYQLTLPASNWDLGGSNPLSPFGVTAGEEMEVLFVSVDSANHTLLMKITDASGSGIPQAYVTIDEDTILSGGEGLADEAQSFFRPLSQATYTIEATKSGYLDASIELDISGDMSEMIIMISE